MSMTEALIPLICWIARGFNVGTPEVYIAPECSGINSVEAMTVLAVLLCCSRQLTWSRRLLILVSSFVLAVAQNVLRVIILLHMAGLLSHTVWNILHNLLGYATALAAILILLYIQFKLTLFKKRELH